MVLAAIMYVTNIQFVPDEEDEETILVEDMYPLRIGKTAKILHDTSQVKYWPSFRHTHPKCQVKHSLQEIAFCWQ